MRGIDEHFVLFHVIKFPAPRRPGESAVGSRAACASDERHIGLKVQDRLSCRSAAMPMGRQVERRPSRCCRAPAGLGLSAIVTISQGPAGGCHGPRAMCGADERHALFQTMPALRQNLARTVPPVSALPARRRRAAVWLVALRAIGQSKRSPPLRGSGAVTRRSPCSPKGTVASNIRCARVSLRSGQAASRRSGPVWDRHSIWASPAGRPRRSRLKLVGTSPW